MIGSHQPEFREGRPMLWGCSGRDTALKPPFRVAPDLGGGEIGVAEERDPGGDAPSWVGRVPLLEMPVVPSLDDGVAELWIRAGRVDRSAESGDLGREVDRCPDPVDVHVLDPLVDVVATGPDLVEPGRLEGPLRLGATDDGAEAGQLVALAVEQPDLVAGLIGHQAGCSRLESSRHPPFEDVGGLHQVVVDRDHRVGHGTGLGIHQVWRPLLEIGHLPLFHFFPCLASAPSSQSYHPVVAPPMTVPLGASGVVAAWPR
jgi:hypothetical protein